MQVELSEGTLKKAEQFVLAGEYPNVDAAIAAALDVLDCAACTEPRPYDPLDDEAREDLALGRFRTADDEFMAELRAKAEAIIAAKSNQ